MREKDEGDRLRRLSAVMRFLAHMRESANEADLLESLIQAAAVWYDLDARAYRRELNGRFVLQAWLPGADVSHDPRELDVQALLTPAGPAHVSSLADLEQLGWPSLQGELLLLPISVGDQVRRLLAVPGTVERDIEATLMLICRTAGAVLEQLSERRCKEVQGRVMRRIAETGGPAAACVRAVMGDFLEAVDAAGARVTVRRSGHPPIMLFATGSGSEGWATEPVPPLEPGAGDVGMERIALGLGLGSGASAVIELLAPPERPFSIEAAQTVRSAADLLGIWLAGITLGTAQSVADRAAAPPPPPAPPFEDAMQAELSRARRLRLSGGVLVASALPDRQAMAMVIQIVRTELRSSDLLGQLKTGDVAAVLVRATSEGVATAALRVRQRLDALAREHRLPPVVVGHALYPGAGGDSPLTLVDRARKDAGLMFS